MTTTVKASEPELSISVDYVPGARGHGVLAIGSDHDGAEALAVWRLGPTGSAGGAWVMRLDVIRQDADHLCRVMCLLRDRCLVDWTSDMPLTIVEKLHNYLPADLVAGLQNGILTIPDLLAEIAKHRSTYAGALEKHRATAKSKIAPLMWPSVIPEQADLTNWSINAQPATASPVGIKALALSAALARTAELWHDTEQVRYRRPYLRSYGEPQALPPRWLARLQTAAGSSEREMRNGG